MAASGGLDDKNDPTQESDLFHDPLGVSHSLATSDGQSDSGFNAAAEEESDEFDFEYYLSQISPTVTKGLEQMALFNGRNGGGSVARTTTSSQDDFDSDEFDLFINVDSPEKHVSTMESYITFRVTTKTTRAEYEGGDFQVRRRYNDFLWLRQRLEETQPTHIVPPLPEKHSLKRFDRFNQEFVKTRMSALQNFLQRIADHPVLSFNKNVQVFLTAKQWEFQAAKKEGSGVMSRWADSFHNMSAAYLMKNRPPEFVEATAYIYLFGEKLGVIDRISQRVVKEQFDLLTELNDWGPVFTLWSTSEDKLSKALSAVAKAVENCYASLQDLVDKTEAEFSQPLKEYFLYAEAIKSVLRKRDAIQAEYEALVDELNKKREEKETMVRQVEQLNDRTTCANADLKADLDRWHRNKRKDFKKIFTNLADRQIQYYQKCLQAWEEVIPRIQKSDVDTDESNSSSRTSPRQAGSLASSS